MKRLLRRIVAVCTLTIGLAVSAHRAGADCPQYLFIQPNYGGYGQLGPTQTYAYGWFGVAPRRLWTFHWDYYGGRWIWH